MKKLHCLLAFTLCLSFAAYSQDEGNIVKRERITRDKSIFFGLGPSFTLGKNIGDYSTGINFELGFTKRLNRILSIGPSLSYLKFNYDPEKTGVNNVFVQRTIEFGDAFNYWPALYVNFKGGDLSLVSVAVNLKVNFVPVMDESKISIYAFAKPFITSASRSEVTGTAYIFAIPDYDDSGDYDEAEVLEGASEYVADVLSWEAGSPDWQQYDVTISDNLKEDSRITGGIFVGPGVEILPAKNVSFYAQAAFGYTFPVSFVSTKKYKGNDLDRIDEEYPVTEEGFPSVNLQFGVSFNF